MLVLDFVTKYTVEIVGSVIFFSLIAYILYLFEKRYGWNDTCRLVENYGERRIILWFIHCCNCFLTKLVYGLGFKGLPSLLRLEIGWGVGLAPHSVMGK